MRADASHVHQLQYAILVPIFGVTAFQHGSEVFPVGTAEYACIKERLEFQPFGSRQHSAIGAKKFEAVPGGGIMASRNLDASCHVQLPNGQPACGCWSNSQVFHFAAGFQQPGQDCVAKHVATPSAIPAQHNPFAMKVGSQGRGKNARLLCG